jgi:hypothetical protein
VQPLGRGRRSDACGTTVAATSATTPPTTASSHRLSPARGFGSRVVTTTDCPPAWVTVRAPAWSSTALDIAKVTTTAICHQPVPTQRTNRSPIPTPSATPA